MTSRACWSGRRRSEGGRKGTDLELKTLIAGRVCNQE